MTDHPQNEALRQPSNAQLKEWRRLVENTTMVSGLGAYRPEEFLVLLDEVDRLRAILAARQPAPAPMDVARTVVQCPNCGKTGMLDAFSYALPTVTPAPTETEWQKHLREHHNSGGREFICDECELIIAKEKANIAEPTVTVAAPTLREVLQLFRDQLVDGQIIKESDGEPWPLSKSEADQIITELEKRLRTPADLDRQNQALGETRFDEAKWWIERFTRDDFFIVHPWNSHPQDCRCETHNRLAELEAALQVAGAQGGKP